MWTTIAGQSRSFQPGNTVGVRGQQSSTVPPLTQGGTCWASVPSVILCIVTMAGHKVSEVKRVSGAGVHPKSTVSGYQHQRCWAGYVPEWRHCGVFSDSKQFTGHLSQKCVHVWGINRVQRYFIPSHNSTCQVFLLEVTFRQLLHSG